MTTPIRLMIVDDEPMVRQGMAMILGAEDDLQVVGEAADGAEALRVIRAARPNLVCMDVRIPASTACAPPSSCCACRAHRRCWS